MNTLLSVLIYGCVVIGAFMLWAGTLGNGLKRDSALGRSALFLLAGIAIAWWHDGAGGIVLPLVVAGGAFVLFALMLGRKRY
jgi:hypothetical protein